MHKRKSALANSPALVSLKLCIFFPPFPPFSVLFLPFFVSFRLFLSFFPFSCPLLSFSVLFYLSLSFYILFYPFSALFCLIKSSPPSVVLLYPFLPSFTLSSLIASYILPYSAFVFLCSLINFYLLLFLPLW